MQNQQKIQMVDLHGQYMRIKAEIDAAVAEVIGSSAFINGPAVGRFASALARYTGAAHVIPCGNGTDALQIALMALGLKPGDEVIVPAFTYVASAEVIALLGLRPVLVDVDRETFNTDIRFIEKALTSRTRAVIPVPSPSEPSTPSPTAAAGIPAPSGTSAAPHFSPRRTSAATETAAPFSRTTLSWRSASA